MPIIEQKIIFKNKRKPIEIFCPQKYRGYYVRGQIEEFSDNVYDGRFPEGYAYAYYRTILFVLIGKDYKEEGFGNDDFGCFYHKTIDEYRKEIGQDEKSYLKELIERDAKVIIKNDEIKKYEPKALGQYLENKRKELLAKYQNDPIEVNINDAHIVESQYLLKAIKQKSNIILLNRIISFDRAELPSNHALVDCPKHIYYLPAYHLSDFSKYYNKDAHRDIVYISPGFFSSDEDSFTFANRKEYLADFSCIGDISWNWIQTKTFSNNDFKLLNCLYSKIKEKEDPYKEYYLSFLDDLISDLKNSKIIGQCSYCGDFFKYGHSKKYCSLKSDSKDCGTSARNKRYYNENRDKILPKNRKYAKKYRAL